MLTGYSKKTGTNPFKGKKRLPFSSEHKLKMSLAKLGKPNHHKSFPSGKKGKHYSHLQGTISPKWKGGTFKYWSKFVKIRDNYICQMCGLQDIEIMDVDHIKSKKVYPELAFNPSNLITLCPNCHRRKTLRNKEFRNHEKH